MEENCFPVICWRARGRGINTLSWLQVLRTKHQTPSRDVPVEFTWGLNCVLVLKHFSIVPRLHATDFADATVGRVCGEIVTHGGYGNKR